MFGYIFPVEAQQAPQPLKDDEIPRKGPVRVTWATEEEHPNGEYIILHTDARTHKRLMAKRRAKEYAVAGRRHVPGGRIFWADPEDFMKCEKVEEK